MICERCKESDDIKRIVLGRFICKRYFDDYQRVLELQRQLILTYWDNQYVRPKTVEECRDTPCRICMYLVGKHCRDGFYDRFIVKV